MRRLVFNNIFKYHQTIADNTIAPIPIKSPFSKVNHFPYPITARPHRARKILIYFILFIFSLSNRTANNIAKTGDVYNATTALPTLVIVNHTKYKYILNAFNTESINKVFTSPFLQKTF